MIKVFFFEKKNFSLVFYSLKAFRHCTDLLREKKINPLRSKILSFILLWHKSNNEKSKNEIKNIANLRRNIEYISEQKKKFMNDKSKSMKKKTHNRTLILDSSKIALDTFNLNWIKPNVNLWPVQFQSRYHVNRLNIKKKNNI